MLTFSQFGTPQWGNLGNRLFQYASLIGLAHKYNCSYCLPQWPWHGYFKQVPDIRSVHTDLEIREEAFHYCGSQFHQYKDHFSNQVVGVSGWLQTEQYWQENKDAVMDALRFNDSIRGKIYNRFASLLDKKTICISIRRGDFVDNPNHKLLPVSYYYLALFHHFPDWRNYNIIIFSDDLPYCKAHFSCLSNCYFAEDLNPVEQLVLGTFCDHFIISNSTFSWWLAYLGQKQDSIVIRPAYVFAGKLQEENDIKDHYPENWLVFDHHRKKLDLPDVTVIIPVHYDHPDRKRNLDIITTLLLADFDLNIIVGEQGGKVFSYVDQFAEYVSFGYKEFHHTKMVNQLTLMATTPVIINYDADVIFPPLQLYEAVLKVREGLSDFVYPYDGRFAQVPQYWQQSISRYNDIGILANTTLQLENVVSVGGALVYNKQRYIEAGGDNERFISYAAEDMERYWRFSNLGYKVSRIGGMLYHLTHYRGMNSGTAHAHWEANVQEYEYELSLSAKELRGYIDNWGYVRDIPVTNRVMCIIVNNDNSGMAQHMYGQVECDKYLISNSPSAIGAEGPDGPYYSAHFNKASELFLKSDATHCLFVCSNISGDLPSVIDRVKRLPQYIGIYTPAINDTGYEHLKPGVKGWKNVAAAERMIFCATREVISAVFPIDTAISSLGWGIDLYMGFICRNLGLKCIVDTDVVFGYKDELQYDIRKADDELKNFIDAKGPDFTAFCGNFFNGLH